MAYPHPLPYPYPPTLSSIPMKRPSFLVIARRIYTREGIRGFYRGLGPCLLRAFPSNACAFFVYEGMMRNLGAEKVSLLRHIFASFGVLTQCFGTDASMRFTADRCSDVVRNINSSSMVFISKRNTDSSRSGPSVHRRQSFNLFITWNIARVANRLNHQELFRGSDILMKLITGNVV
jgi:hypothetical protein